MISIVTITKDNPDELRKTLQSISKVKGIESVVINGGKDTIPNARVNEPDQGIADAFNKGFKHSSGNAIIFLNSGDTLLDQSYFEKSLKIFEKNPEVSYVYSDILFEDQLNGTIQINADPKKKTTQGMPFPHPSLIVRKKVFEEIGLFNTSLKIAMDYDFVIRLRKKNYRGKYLPGPVVLMDGKGVASSKRVENLKEFLKVLKSHHKFSEFAIPGFFISARVLSTTLLRKIGLGFIINKLHKP